MKKSESQISETEVLTKNIVFVDGITRVGKTMLCNVLAYIRNVSPSQMIDPLEQLLPMYATGHIDRNAVSAFLRIYLNKQFYNFKLSRDVNFRYNDLTSVHNSYRTKELFQNLHKADGDAVIDELRNDADIFQFMTHDLMTHYSLFKDLIFIIFFSIFAINADLFPKGRFMYFIGLFLTKLFFLSIEP